VRWPVHAGLQPLFVRFRRLHAISTPMHTPVRPTFVSSRVPTYTHSFGRVPLAAQADSNKSPGTSTVRLRAKDRISRLASQIPQASERSLYALCQPPRVSQLEPRFVLKIRLENNHPGALNNGRDWIFFLLKCTRQGGAVYFRPPGINPCRAMISEVFPGMFPPLIAAIIADWA